MRKIIVIILLLIIIILAIYVSYMIMMKEYDNIIMQANKYKSYENTEKVDTSFELENKNIDAEIDQKPYVIIDNSTINSQEITDWRLILVNHENALPEDFSITLANIDNTRQFDSRAINELNNMLKDMKKSGVSNVWVQSAYRSIDYQTQLFNEKVNTYIKSGKTREEAENLTLKTINKPGTSEHNLGLAVDFNYIDYSFENTRTFKWLQENAENYGFILRYKKEKEDITKVDYEPWHWRYVGVENAKKMNELDMCLEEYIDKIKQG